jgi:hypothetical protein
VTVLTSVRGLQPIDGLGEWDDSFALPSAGQPWTFTVPAGEAWRLHLGACRIQTSATVGLRVPFVRVTVGGSEIFFEGNIDETGTPGGPGQSTAGQIAYRPFEAMITRLFTALPDPCPLPVFWLRPGTIIEGSFDGMQAGDQVTALGFLIEKRPV